VLDVERCAFSAFELLVFPSRAPTYGRGRGVDLGLATRSSIGVYFFSPPGENERLINQAGFKLLEARDTTASAATLSKRWRDAREKRKSALMAIETEANFIGLQRFLTCVYSLTAERRLLRFLYVMEK
jgi:hypothetical protein